MILFSGCKLNLGLRVVAKRPDGYHNIQSIFYPFPYFDVLEVHESQSFAYLQQGLAISAELKHNLCYKTWDYFAKHYAIPPLTIYHQKSVPIGAGLGGGSANVASLIQCFNHRFELELSGLKQVQIAAKLSADAPFFLQDSAALVTGLGDIVEPLPLVLPANYGVILCVPKNFAIATAEIFAQISPKARAAEDLRQLSLDSIANSASILTNDFEPIVFAKYPQLAKIKAQFLADGALFASMTGTGAGIYAIFENPCPIDCGKYPDSKLYQLDCASHKVRAIA